MLGWENHNFAIITVSIGSGNVIKSGMQKLGESFDEEEAIYMVLKCTPPARLLINSKRKYSNSAVNKSGRMFDWITGIDWIKVSVTNETRWSRGDFCLLRILTRSPQPESKYEEAPESPEQETSPLNEELCPSQMSVLWKTERLSPMRGDRADGAATYRS